MLVQDKKIFTYKKAHFYRSPSEDVWGREERRGEAKSTLHTFGKRSLYTWFIITTSLSNVPQLLPGLNDRAELIQVLIKPETLKRWCSQGHKQSALNQNAAFLHSKCLAGCIYCKLGVVVGNNTPAAQIRFLSMISMTASVACTGFW